MSTIYVCVRCGSTCDYVVINKNGKFVKRFRCEECGFEKDVEFTHKEGEEWQ